MAHRYASIHDPAAGHHVSRLNGDKHSSVSFKFDFDCQHRRRDSRRALDTIACVRATL